MKPRRLRPLRPSLENVAFRKHMLSDPASMAYHRGHHMLLDGYDPETGCLPFPEASWPAFLEAWLDREDRALYFLEDEAGRLLGEINDHPLRDGTGHAMGIVILASERGQGLGKAGMALLLEAAFLKGPVKRLTNSFEADRATKQLLAFHQSFGFERQESSDDLVHVLRCREAYLAAKKKD